MLSKRETGHLCIFLFACLMAMFSFFLSRFLLSVAVILLTANAFSQSDFKERFQSVIKNPLFSAISTIFLIALVSGIWSENKSVWIQSCITKLPLLFFPFVFVMQKGMNKSRWIWLSIAWIALTVFGSLWTMLQYLQSKEDYEAMYQTSYVLPTWAGDSHIRFSMAVVIALLLWLKLEEWNFNRNINIKWAMRGVMAWLMLFLLILSAKTGWVGLVFVILPLGLYYMIKNGYRKIAFALLLLAFALPFIAYKTIPTFRERINYVSYQLINFREKQAAGVYSDHNRLLSIEAGWDIFRSHWLIGVGYGDLKQAMRDWFDANAPQVPVTERFRPLNQWLNAGAASGIPGVVAVSIAVFLPLFKKEWRSNKPALGFVIFVMLIFLYECMLEDQLGVFLFAFFMLWWNSSHQPGMVNSMNA